MKKIIILLMVLLVLPLCLAIECQDQTDVEDIPCELITPILSIGGDCNATVMDINDLSRNYTINITPVGDGTYNFTFNFSEISQYSIILCDNSSATLDVGHWDEDYNDKWLYFYGAALGLGGFLLILGYKIENNLLIMLSGFLFICFALTFISKGYPGLNNQTINLSIILITLGIGSYLSVGSGISLIGENS